jgi:hypothetical protein
MEIEGRRMTGIECQASESTKERLAEAFHYVRETFFPKWLKGADWEVRDDPGLPYYGWCDDSSRTIFVQSTPAEDDRLHLILIHEICHAITKEPHTKKWRDRFKQAGDTAKKIGRQELANLIYDEVRRSSENVKPPRLNERLIYSTIEDVILADFDVSFKETIEAVAQLWGITLEDVSQFKDCRRVYEETSRIISRLQSQLAGD